MRLTCGCAACGAGSCPCPARGASMSAAGGQSAASQGPGAEAASTWCATVDSSSPSECIGTTRYSCNIRLCMSRAGGILHLVPLKCRDTTAIETMCWCYSRHSARHPSLCRDRVMLLTHLHPEFCATRISTYTAVRKRESARQAAATCRNHQAGRRHTHRDIELSPRSNSESFASLSRQGFPISVVVIPWRNRILRFRDRVNGFEIMQALVHDGVENQYHIYKQNIRIHNI